MNKKYKRRFHIIRAYQNYLKMLSRPILYLPKYPKKIINKKLTTKQEDKPLFTSFPTPPPKRKNLLKSNSNPLKSSINSIYRESNDLLYPKQQLYNTNTNMNSNIIKKTINIEWNKSSTSNLCYPSTLSFYSNKNYKINSQMNNISIISNIPIDNTTTNHINDSKSEQVLMSSHSNSSNLKIIIPNNIKIPNNINISTNDLDMKIMEKNKHIIPKPPKTIKSTKHHKINTSIQHSSRNYRAKNHIDIKIDSITFTQKPEYNKYKDQTITDFISNYLLFDDTQCNAIIIVSEHKPPKAPKGILKLLI